MQPKQPQHRKEDIPAEELLPAAEFLFHSFVKQHIDGIILIDSEGTVLEWNQSMERITAISAQEVIGLKAWHMQMLLTPLEKQTSELQVSQQKAYMDILNAGIVPDELAHKEAQVHRRDGKQIYADQNLFIINIGIKNWLGVLVRDITERKLIEFEREGLIKKLEAQNIELERFIYAVSHDLRSPLVTIKGYLGYLETDAQGGNTERFHKDLKRISSATDRMDILLKDLLELSRIGRMMNAPEEISFNYLCLEALEIIQSILDAKRVSVYVQPNLPAVYGDKPRLVEVLQNLLDNSVKYMGDQSAPQIEIGQRGEEEGKPVFFVKDNGIGIESEFHERIFGLFNQLDPKTEGTGVGLAIVKRIIEVHGGRVWVESEKAKGSTFYFILPKPI